MYRRITCAHCDVEHLDDLSGMEVAHALSVLAGFSFISLGPDGTTVDMHQLVQLAIKAWLDCEFTYESFRSAAVIILLKAYPANPMSRHRICAEIEPHANALSTTCKDFRETGLLYPRAVYNGAVLIGISAAVTMNEKAMLWRKHVLCPSYSATIAVVALQCLFTNATREYTTTIGMGREISGSYVCSSSSDGGTEGSTSNEDEDIMKIRIAVADSHRELGQLDKALRVLEGAMHEQDFDFEFAPSPSVNAYTRLNELVHAGGLLIEVLVWRRRSLGPHSFGIMLVMRYFAILYFNKRDFVRGNTVSKRIIQCLRKEIRSRS